MNRTFIIAAILLAAGVVVVFMLFGNKAGAQTPATATGPENAGDFMKMRMGEFLPPTVSVGQGKSNIRVGVSTTSPDTENTGSPFILGLPWPVSKT